MICEACAEDQHWECDGYAWDPFSDDWRVCLCEDSIHENSLDDELSDDF